MAGHAGTTASAKTGSESSRRAASDPPRSS
jgi:hypothetical protein